ncbi:CubicO group peptidase, beta-lactamase class C family [Aquimarina amphilecti]|uniref:CubicO group peptidase, beta-lactamase class C family n=1 Tax=Aquimarina amphilecti TaxID=1038014 RepID=A0A1H7VVE1_AQUAM|nr:serine hydrolase domain-containing protein [Aquimarina amphilecti]SEM13150.1 CubicO group peptidase, beta-lactamase class C family [Aquimarina amphilecti]
MILKNTSSFFITLFLTTILQSYGQQSLDSEKNISNELDAIFSKEFPLDQPGAAIVLTKGNRKLFEKAYGISDITTKEKITPNTVFNTGSISKTFVANGILILQERGLLSIEDPIYKYFPDFDTPEIAKKITIKHLLSHTSGLPDLRNVRENQEYYITAKDTANFEPIKRTDNLLFEPGEKFMYSNPSYNGLALIIEQVTKQKWQQFIIDNIFIPSGMHTSKITDGDHPKTGVAHAYYKDQKGVYQESDYGEVPTFAASGNGGIWSTINELVSYEEALRTQVFLSAKTVKQSRTVFNPTNWNDSKNPNLGYSWFLGIDGILRSNNNQKIVTPVVSHTGSQGGFRAFYISFPEKGITYVMLANRPIDNFGDIIKESFMLFLKYGLID